MEIGFDIISDLHLDPDDSFNWENKVTSLYCVVAGNISSDLRTIWQTLLHLSRLYQGVFYTTGSLEYLHSRNFEYRTKEINKIASKIPNLAILHQNVVIMNGIAILGCNGWSNDNKVFDDENTNISISHRFEDVMYLKQSVSKLQKHLDVKKIMLVTNAVPKTDLYFGEEPENNNDITLDLCLGADTEMKVTKWVFGTHKKIVDTTIDNVNYINNPYYKVKPYWAKRVNIEI